MNDNNFEKTLMFILQREGGYVNDPNDLGGETNKGITHTTYDSYRRSKGLAKQSVKYITDAEVREIYYNNYYKASGADQLSDPKLAAYVFDTAVNMGVGRAKTFLNQCNGNPETFEKLRRAKYDEFVKAKPSQKRFLQGWNNRVTQLKNYVNTNYPDIDSETEKDKPVFKIGIEKNVYIPFKTPSEAFSEQIRKDYYTKIEENNKMFKLNFKEQSPIKKDENGQWVTINGRHVFIEK